MQNHAYIQLIAKKYFPLSTKSNQLPKTDFKHGAQCKHQLKKGGVKFFPCFYFVMPKEKISNVTHLMLSRWEVLVFTQGSWSGNTI